MLGSLRDSPSFSLLLFFGGSWGKGRNPHLERNDHFHGLQDKAMTGAPLGSLGFSIFDPRDDLASFLAEHTLSVIWKSRAQTKRQHESQT
jgi:hypothetical protein